MKLLHLSLIACLFTTYNALALTSDSEQPIYIDSDKQNLDMKSSKVTFTGDVKLKQGSININADKLIVIRNQKDDTLKEIEAYGEPATFSQLTDEGKTLQGEAKELYYKVATDQLTMISEATLSQDESTIRGQKITYKISSQKLTADGGKNERVKTVLQPAAQAPKQ
ncbi:lipopolysaccharide export system protein LptA [Vibrio sp. MACH09]|uniref:lipopolysaccharide transport periplasmic protein LptA n=1 Tax=unclassified Vibrio TaxID=2614977 RepID=UPI0014937C24|nr:MULTISPECIES: lipopolysaccharide transport periplasmic protein LptA [unclassified Vibrio]NOI65883.1 lipopolysaccharide transport periplasmic protein LptA [Vibrio sp. 99-8-1]GLO59786.1 lipopolysaccharide export system protein LptA [Vibrio sp. MACH09]